MKNIFTLLIVLFAFTITSAQLTIQAPNGDVGIGTDTPGAKLDVEGTGTIFGLRTTKPTVGAGTSLLFNHTDSPGGNFGNFIFLQSNNPSRSNGIGFRVAGPSSSGAQFTLGNTSNQDQNLYFIIRDGGINQDAYKIDTGLNSHGANGLTIGNAYFSSAPPTNGLIVQSTLGIGTNSPDQSAMLHVNGKAVKTGNLAWEVVSDRRLKSNIKKYNRGLDEIMNLNPVTYKYNGKAGIIDTETEFVGLIAQEYSKIVPEAVSSFKYNNIESTGNKEDYTYKERIDGSEEYLSINSGDIVFMLVNAVKEQQKVIDKLNSRIDKLEKLNIDSKDLEIINETEVSFNSEANISQNAPNPFNNQTVISYYVPKNSSSANIQIFDATGAVIKNIPLQTGNGELTINSGELPSGIYNYSLVINNQIVKTNKMILTK